MPYLAQQEVLGKISPNKVHEFKNTDRHCMKKGGKFMDVKEIMSRVERVKKKTQELNSLTSMVKEVMRGALKKEDFKSLFWLLESKKRELEEEAEKLTDALRNINFR